MTLLRVVVSCSVLLCMGGCSHLLSVPTQYSSLPALNSPAVVPDEALTPVDVPGRLLAIPSRGHGANVEPFAVLQRSATARSGWKELRPDELTKPALIARRSNKGLSGEPASTASLPEAGKSATSGQTAFQNYDREATMDDLVRGGQNAAKPICLGC